MDAMFIMTQDDLDFQIPVFTHQHDCPSTILINENISSYSVKDSLVKIILTNDQIIRYSNAITQSDNETMNENNKSPLKDASTVTDYNLSNSKILNENQNPELIKLNDFDESINFSDDEIMLSNDSEEDIFEDDENMCDDNISQPVIYGNYIPSNNSVNPNILVTPNNLNSGKIMPPFKEKAPKKNRINLTPEARRFRDSFYKCYGDKKRFSKLVVRNIHNSICGALGLPRMSRSEYRSILLYFNNYAPYRQKIIQAINMKKGFILDPLDSANAKIFALH